MTRRTRMTLAAFFCLLFFLAPGVPSLAADYTGTNLRAVDGGAVKASIEVLSGGAVERFQFKGKKGLLPPTALHVGRNAVWVGHDGAVSWMKKDSGEWKTAGVDTEACPGGAVHSLAEDEAGGVWFRIGNEGGVCGFSPSDGSWKEFFDIHVIDGTKAAAAGGKLFLTGRGGPEHEGVSIFNAATGAPVNYYHTKPVSSMLADGDLLWVGESAGLLQIDMKKNAYRYFLPRDTGCGIDTTAIAAFGGRIAIATRSGYTGYMGDRMELSRDRLRVYVKETGRWFDYGKGAEDRDRLNEDIKSGAVPVTKVMTRGGVCIYEKSSGKWKRFGAGEGLPSEEADAAAAAGGRLFVSTTRGLAALDAGGRFKPVRAEAGRLTGKIKTLDTDGKSLWMLTTEAVYRAGADRLMKQ